MTDELRLWGQMDDEMFIHYDADECIEYIIDGYHPEPIADIGEITVYEHRPMTPTAKDCGEPLEQTLEFLDEEYGNPDEGTEPTPAMREAEKVFVAAVLAEYRPWACEPTGNKVTVNALAWVRQHRPDWLQTTGVQNPDD